MRQNIPPVKVSLLILLAVLCWRMIGAPVTAEDFQNLKTPFWQAKVQLPLRLERIWKLWQPARQKTSETEVSQETEATVMVYLTQEGRMAEMRLSDYVTGVIAAEMPAQYHLEALRAQAVAARTRVLRQMQEGGCALHPGAAICTDSAHCQGYATLARCRERWGESWESYAQRIRQAERDTRGQVLTYSGELITVLYHAISGGRTESASAVFAQEIPYLISVESYGEEQAKGFLQETHVAYEVAAQKLRPLLREGITAEKLRQTLSVAGYTPSGRVDALQVGDETVKASDFRRALGLRSTWFSLSMDENGMVFQQRGYGHGVGMSQTGANSMAAGGAAYAEILQHYYPGTVLENH